MNLWITLETGLREIAAHKFRSFLSMLGIVLGVSSLIATMSLTNGIERGTKAFMQQVGGLELVTVIGKEISAEMIEFANLSPGRTVQDARAILASTSVVTEVSPEINIGALLSSGPISQRMQVVGAWPDYFAVNRHEIAAGRFLTQLDVDRAAHSVVIGDAILKRFWPNLPADDAVGRILTINQAPFKIVGVLKVYEREQDKRMREIVKARQPQMTSRAQNRWDPFRRKNESVVIPLSTMFFEYKSGQLPEDSLDSIRMDNLSFRVGDLDRFRETLSKVRNALNITHRGVDDFDLQTREEWFQGMEASISATRLSGGLIAAISLIVGGIGITNIMLASITERVREIGIRLAVGARGADIFLQILVESVSVAFIGGIIGIAAGFGLIKLLIAVAPSENVPFVSLDSIVISVVFAIIAGVLSGIYPALRASRLDPISALRYE
ncbi:MAG: ABC transporter permease [Verrucomicrobia bacterium]|nr:ABC transporter permease [Verrucomicrobiota bacterium]